MFFVWIEGGDREDGNGREREGKDDEQESGGNVFC